MNWKVRLALLLLSGLPAFTGWPLGRFPAAVLPGVNWAPVAYLAAVHLVLFALAGGARYRNALGITALVTLPVVFGGGAVSWLLTAAGLGEPRDAHYVRLCVTMLTVVPLALILVATLPLAAFEQRLLRDPGAVSLRQRQLLMFLRVFNHIVHFVVPTLLEVAREERLLRPPGGAKSGRRAPAALLAAVVTIGVAGICGAVQYVPLWAEEIARLGEKDKGKGKSEIRGHFKASAANPNIKTNSKPK